MPPKTAAIPQPHMGRKIEKIRTLKGIKQTDLAKKLGMAASALSVIENSEKIEEDKLQQIADALEMSVEALKNFNEDAVVQFIQNNYDNATGQLGSGPSQTNHFNPLDEYMKMVEDYKKQGEEIKKLNQLLLEEKERHIKALEGLLKNA